MNERVNTLKLGCVNLPGAWIPKNLPFVRWPAPHQRLNIMPTCLQERGEMTSHQTGRTANGNAQRLGETCIAMPGEIVLSSLVTKVKRPVELPSHESSCKERANRRQRELIAEPVFEDGGSRILGGDDVFVAPRPERSLDLYVCEDHVSCACLMDKLPGHGHWPQLDPKLLPVSWLNGSVRGNHTDIHPWRCESLEGS
jgi:hypothetical protein